MLEGPGGEAGNNEEPEEGTKNEESEELAEDEEPEEVAEKEKPEEVAEDEEPDEEGEKGANEAGKAGGGGRIAREDEATEEDMVNRGGTKSENTKEKRMTEAFSVEDETLLVLPDDRNEDIKKSFL
jgi:hypothetical protein